MPIYRNKTFFAISAGACILISLMILVLPLQWLIAAVLAAGVHEVCHALAVLLCGSKVSGLSLRRNGAVMTAQPMTLGRELICTLAGPVGSLSLLLFVQWIPRIAFCAGVHGIYNLLPLSHLDGGKALFCVLAAVFPQNVERACCIVQTVCLMLLWLVAAYLSIFRRLGLMPVVFMLTLTHAAKKDLANMA